MNPNRFQALTWSAALCMCFVLPGCLIGSKTSSQNSGKFVSQNTLAQIEPGKDKSYVVALIGDPTSKTKLDDSSELWKWCYTQDKRSTNSVIFLVGTESHTATERTTFVEFHDGKVVKAWAD
ncbi:MAG TPA: outer membrane protein assembly factor BamE [Planctomycetota bacterium]|nr:outer membrane protein assembly factor BamE [Planctomycetota bacterium]